jgi:hypothetical protein
MHAPTSSSQLRCPGREAACLEPELCLDVSIGTRISVLSSFTTTAEGSTGAVVANRFALARLDSPPGAPSRRACDEIRNFFL